MNLVHIQAILKKGALTTELELHQALTADRKLRLLAQKDPSLKKLQSDLRALIQAYEENTWVD